MSYYRYHQNVVIGLGNLTIMITFPRIWKDAGSYVIESPFISIEWDN